MRMMHDLMTVELPDGSVWGVPVEIIAKHRAEHYASEFGGGVERSLAEDTIPLFESDEYEIHDWVAQMIWSDFDGHQVKVADAQTSSDHLFELALSAVGIRSDVRIVDFQSAWASGPKDFANAAGDVAPRPKQP